MILEAREHYRREPKTLPDGPITPWSQRVAEMMRDKEKLSKLSTAINAKHKHHD